MEYIQQISSLWRAASRKSAGREGKGEKKKENRKRTKKKSARSIKRCKKDEVGGGEACAHYSSMRMLKRTDGSSCKSSDGNEKMETK